MIDVLVPYDRYIGLQQPWHAILTPGNTPNEFKSDDLILQLWAPNFERLLQALGTWEIDAVCRKHS